MFANAPARARRAADPYLNVDAGTMSPFEHGEVFVLDDGGEARPQRGAPCARGSVARRAPPGAPASRGRTARARRRRQRSHIASARATQLRR